MTMMVTQIPRVHAWTIERSFIDATEVLLLSSTHAHHIHTCTTYLRQSQVRIDPTSPGRRSAFLTSGPSSALRTTNNQGDKEGQTEGPHESGPNTTQTAAGVLNTTCTHADSWWSSEASAEVYLPHSADTDRLIHQVKSSVTCYLTGSSPWSLSDFVLVGGSSPVWCRETLLMFTEGEAVMCFSLNK